LVLLIGSLITLGYPAFFGASNLTAQMLMTAALAALVALSLLLAVVFDFPFSGDVKISASPFDGALQEMVPPPTEGANYLGLNLLKTVPTKTVSTVPLTASGVPSWGRLFCRGCFRPTAGALPISRSARRSSSLSLRRLHLALTIP
jgi:hypothetical protein